MSTCLYQAWTARMREDRRGGWLPPSCARYNTLGSTVAKHSISPAAEDLRPSFATRKARKQVAVVYKLKAFQTQHSGVSKTNGQGQGSCGVHGEQAVAELKRWGVIREFHRTEQCVKVRGNDETSVDFSQNTQSLLGRIEVDSML